MQWENFRKGTGEVLRNDETIDISDGADGAGDEGVGAVRNIKGKRTRHAPKKDK